MERRGEARGGVEEGSGCSDEDREPSTSARFSRGFLVGTAVGVTLCGLFNPVDRALYLSVVEHRPFLSPLNFANPWEGFREAVVVRTVTGGLFFPLFETWLGLVTSCWHWLRPSVDAGRSLACNTVAGQLTGVTIGVCMNPINVVKYRMWGSADTTFRCFRSTARGLWRENGARAFGKGALVTAMRDATFGGAYSGGRRALAAALLGERKPNRAEALAVDLTAGSMATACSSPLNYCRNLQFASPVLGSPGICQALRELWAEALHRGRADARGRVMGTSAYLQARMRLGWGTARVGCGMALGQGMYDFLMAAS